MIPSGQSGVNNSGMETVELYIVEYLNTFLVNCRIQRLPLVPKIRSFMHN